MPKRHTKHTSERALWNRIRGSSRRCAGARRSLDKRLETLFPKKYGGEELIMRRLLLYFGQMVESGIEIPRGTPAENLRDFHPEAFRFLSRHGQFYRPKPYRKTPCGEPHRGRCYLNAQSIMFSVEQMRAKRPGDVRYAPTQYVEGIAFGAMAQPMMHGWNARERSVLDRHAFDWTFYAASQWIRYVGIPMSAGEYLELSTTKRPRRFKRRGIYLSTQILSRRNFGIKMRVKLLQLIADRKRAGKKLPVRAAR